MRADPVGIRAAAALLPDRPFGIGGEVGRIARLDAGPLGELPRARTGEHGERALEDAPGERDRVRDPAHGGDRSDVEVLAIHHPGVELDDALLGQRRATARPEDARSLEVADRGLDGIERAAAVVEHTPAGAAPPRGSPRGSASLGRAGCRTPRRGPRSRMRARPSCAPGPRQQRRRSHRRPSARARSARGRWSHGRSGQPGETRVRRRPTSAPRTPPAPRSVRSEARISSSVTSTMSPTFRGSRRGSGATGAAGRSGSPRRSSPRAPRPSASAAPARNARASGAQALLWTPIRRGTVSIRPAARRRPNPRWTPSSSVPPPSGATTASGARLPSCSNSS